MTHLSGFKNRNVWRSRVRSRKTIHGHVTGAVKLRGCGLFILSPAKPWITTGLMLGKQTHIGRIVYKWYILLNDRKQILHPSKLPLNGFGCWAKRVTITYMKYGVASAPAVEMLGLVGMRRKGIVWIGLLKGRFHHIQISRAWIGELSKLWFRVKNRGCICTGKLVTNDMPLQSYKRM